MTRTTRLFGTDGVRGLFSEPPLDRATVARLAFELVRLLEAPSPRIVLGGDTRASTPALAGWIADSVAAAGGTIAYAGVIPTPGVAFLTRELGADAGIMISASHNPHPDNGIKILSRDGFKLDDELEARLEERVARSRHCPPPSAGSPEPDPTLAPSWLASVRASLEEAADRPLEGLRIVVDAGNGAAAPHARALFASLGAETFVLGDQPDGSNINRDCGSTAPEAVAEQVRQRGCDLGFAFDGDADRVIACDEHGRIRDGDDLLWVWARALRERGQLDPPAIVATTMSNLGLDLALRAEGIEVIRCGVGDRQVVETMRTRGLKLGGETSGHLIDLAHATTGDGLLTAIQIAAIVQRSGEPASRSFDGLVRNPQILRNVPVRRKPDLSEVPELHPVVRAVESELGERGRLVLRYSGTEPLARIMIEGPEREQIERLSARLAEALHRHLG